MRAARPDAGPAWWGRAAVLLNLLVAALYAGSAELGLSLALLDGQVTPFWPPTGISLTALLLGGMRMAPGIALGAAVSNTVADQSALYAVAVSVGNTVAPLCAAVVLRRLGFRLRLRRLWDALILVFPGALGSMLISATVGTVTLLATDAIAPSGFWRVWLVWWTGDALGVFLLTPALLALYAAARRWAWPVLPRLLEAALLLGGSALVAMIATRSAVNLLFLIVPFLMWAAVRFQLAGAAPCAVVVSVIACSAAADEAGPFAEHELAAQMLTLQAFNATTALSALFLSALITERNDTERQIARVSRELAETVAALTPGPGRGGG
jgi:integral membrane sensor domain MASE1